jgi:hypothetical protein
MKNSCATMAGCPRGRMPLCHHTTATMPSYHHHYAIVPPPLCHHTTATMPSYHRHHAIVLPPPCHRTTATLPSYHCHCGTLPLCHRTTAIQHELQIGMFKGKLRRRKLGERKNPGRKQKTQISFSWKSQIGFTTFSLIFYCLLLFCLRFIGLYGEKQGDHLIPRREGIAT